jgi:hypothetical protein
MVDDDYYGGCLARAQERWLGCLKNGGKPRPGEVPEWGDDDEETWRNYGR